MHGVSFKKRAPRAIKAIREFAVKAMVSLSSPFSFRLFAWFICIHVGKL